MTIPADGASCCCRSCPVLGRKWCEAVHEGEWALTYRAVNRAMESPYLSIFKKVALCRHTRGAPAVGGGRVWWRIFAGASGSRSRICGCCRRRKVSGGCPLDVAESKTTFGLKCPFGGGRRRSGQCNRIRVGQGCRTPHNDCPASPSIGRGQPEPKLSVAFPWARTLPRFGRGCPIQSPCQCPTDLETRPRYRVTRGRRSWRRPAFADSAFRHPTTAPACVSPFGRYQLNPLRGQGALAARIPPARSAASPGKEEWGAGSREVGALPSGGPADNCGCSPEVGTAGHPRSERLFAAGGWESGALHAPIQAKRVYWARSPA